MRRLLLAAACLAALAGSLPPAGAAGPVPQNSQTQTFPAFTLVARAPDLTATSSSGLVALGSRAGVALVFNSGSNIGYVALGSDNTVTVSAANGIPVAAGSCVSLNATGMTYLAGISASGTTLQTSLGTGWPGGCGGGGSGGGGGGGGAVTAADGAFTNLGTLADAAWASGNGTLTAIGKAIVNALVNNVYVPGTAGTPSTQVLTTQSPTSNFVSGTTAAMTGTTSTQLIAAVASNRIYVTSLSCVNSHASVGTLVTVQDGSGGTALRTMAAGSVFQGDEANGGNRPLFRTTSGNGVFVADVTTGANVICNAAGYSGP